MAQPPSNAPELEPTKIILLDKPIDIPGGAKITELKLQEPTGAEMVACDSKEGWEYTTHLVGLNSGVTPLVARKLPVRVLNEAAAYLTPFFNAVRPTS